VDSLKALDPKRPIREADMAGRFMSTRPSRIPGPPRPSLRTQQRRVAQVASLSLLQLRPRLPGVPALLKLRLGLFQGRHAIRSRHRTVDGHRPEPAQAVGTATGLIDATNIPLAGKDGARQDSFLPSWPLCAPPMIWGTKRSEKPATKHQKSNFARSGPLFG
jgi:hypothetical protein